MPPTLSAVGHGLDRSQAPEPAPERWRGARLVVFDLDGTLVDSLDDIALAVNRALSRLHPGARALPTPTVRRFVGHGARVLMARSLEAVGSQRSLDEAVDVLRQTYRESMLQTTRLYPGVAETLQGLDGRRRAVLTNKPGDISRAILSGLGIDHYFDAVMGGGDGAPHKPDPDGLRRIMAAYGASPDETLMVGDSGVDVRTGRAAGALTAGVSYGLFPEDFAHDPPHALLDRLPALLPLLGLQSVC